MKRAISSSLLGGAAAWPCSPEDAPVRRCVDLRVGTLWLRKFTRVKCALITETLRRPEPNKRSYLGSFARCTRHHAQPPFPFSEVTVVSGSIAIRPPFGRWKSQDLSREVIWIDLFSPTDTRRICGEAHRRNIPSVEALSEIREFESSLLSIGHSLLLRHCRFCRRKVTSPDAFLSPVGFILTKRVHRLDPASHDLTDFHLVADLIRGRPSAAPSSGGSDAAHGGASWARCSTCWKRLARTSRQGPPSRARIPRRRKPAPAHTSTLQTCPCEECLSIVGATGDRVGH